MACWLLTLVLAACATGDGSRPSGSPPQRPDERVVVASLNFPENELLAEIYAQALESVGVPVRRELDLGPRELVQPALRQGLVDVVPEYLGTALSSLSPAGKVSARTDAASRVAVRRALARALSSWGVEVLTPAPAEDQNALVVTRVTAQQRNLHTISDLARSGAITLGAPPECPSRPYCLPGLQRVYGLRVSTLVPLATEGQRSTALEQGVVDAALLFTTDGRLPTSDLVVLADDGRLQPVENVVPVVTTRAIQRYGPRVVDVLDRISALLTQQNLVFLNWRVDVAGKPIAAEARGWLQRKGLVPRSG